MTVDTDFGGFSLYFDNTQDFQFRCWQLGDEVMHLSRRQVEALKMMFEAALDTSAEELGDELA